MSDVPQVALFTHAQQVHLEGSTIAVQSHSCAGYHEGTKGGGFKALKAATAHAAFHNSGERHQPPKCHPDTREAILNKIISWVKGEIDTEAFVFWLNGSVGVGKSAIAQTIAEMCEKEGLLLASFFFARSDATRNNAKLLVTTLSYQIALVVPPVRSHIEQVFEHDPLIDTRALDTQAAKLLVEPLQRATAARIHIPPLIVIDGLDECYETSEQCNLLDIVSRLGRALNVASRRLIFLIASRPEQEISLKFNSRTLEGVSTQYSLDSQFDSQFFDSYPDIHRFLVDGFNEIKDTHPLKSSLPPSWPSINDLRILEQQADGQFLYATLALNYTSSIGHRPEVRLATILDAGAGAEDNPFAALDTLYHHILSTIDNVECLLTVVGLQMTMCEGGLCEIVRERLGMEAEDVKLLFWDIPSLVEVYSEDTFTWRLRFRHASLVEYLTNQRRSRQYHIKLGSYHAEWAIWSLTQAWGHQLGGTYLGILHLHFSLLIPSLELRAVLQTCDLVSLYPPDVCELLDHTSGINVHSVALTCFIIGRIRHMACDDAENLYQFQAGAFKRHIISLLECCSTHPLTTFTVHLLLSTSALCRLEVLYTGWQSSNRALKCICPLLLTDSTDLLNLCRTYPFFASLIQDSEADCGTPLRDAVDNIRAVAAPVLLHYLSRPPELCRMPPFKWFLEKLKTCPWISRRRSSVRKKLRTWCKLYKFCSWCPTFEPNCPPRWPKGCIHDHPEFMFQVWAYVSSSSSLSSPHITTLHETPRLLAYLYALVLLPEVLAKAPRSEELIASCRAHIFHRASILFPRRTKAARAGILKYLERMEAEERRWKELWLD